MAKIVETEEQARLFNEKDKCLGELLGFTPTEWKVGDEYYEIQMHPEQVKDLEKLANG